MKVYKLFPHTTDNIWGGNRLREYGKESEKDRIAESWELSFYKNSEAKISDGRTLDEAFPASKWGKNCVKFKEFPVLTKLIDAKQKLSVQVHPSDEYALQNEGQYGKTEMWYIVSATEGSGIYLGFSKEYTKEEIEKALAEETLEKLLCFKEVKAGESYFIPAGTVHAIGDGVLIFEVQQNSAVTYRLYDYGRLDVDGRKRDLHIQKALDVANLSTYKGYTRADGKDEVISKCSYFEVKKFKLNFTHEFEIDESSFLSLTCVFGEGEIEGIPFGAGDSFFVPAENGRIVVNTKNAEILTVSVPAE